MFLDYFALGLLVFIAIVLFYAVIGRDDPIAFTDRFMTHFLRGYSREFSLDAKWLAEIPWFLKQREIDLYAIIHRSFDVQDIRDPWVANYMKGRKLKIESSIPFIDFDFESLKPLLVK